MYGPFEEKTWPGKARAAMSCLTGPEMPRRLVPLTPALEKARRAAFQTALAMVHGCVPRWTFERGSMVVLGESTAACSFADAKQIPGLARPFVIVEPMASAMPRNLARSPVTFLAGPLPALLKLLANVKRCAHRDNVLDVWPQLAAVVWSRQASDPSPELIRAEVGRGVLMLEMVARHGAPLAVEDAASGLLRWLPNHGVCWEFIPGAEAHCVNPPRVSFERVEVGADYELVQTSPAGLWACRLGETVRFESHQPPLFRVVPMLSNAASEPRPSGSGSAATPLPDGRGSDLSHSIPGPHRRSAGTPAALPESFGHSLSSTPAGRE